MYRKDLVGTNPYSKNIFTNGKDIQAIAVTFPQNATQATDIDGRKIIVRGTVWPANDATAIGLVRHDYDVTDGDVAGAVVTHGSILEAHLPVEVGVEAKPVLESRGIMFTPKATSAL